MLILHSQFREHARSFPSAAHDDRPVVLYEDAAEIKTNMAVRAEAEDVSLDIWPSMRITQWLYVSAFAVRLAIRAHQTNVACLTTTVVEILYAPRRCRIAHQTLHLRGAGLWNLLDIVAIKLPLLQELGDPLLHRSYLLLRIREPVQVKLTDQDVGAVRCR